MHVLALALAAALAVVALVVIVVAARAVRRERAANRERVTDAGRRADDAERRAADAERRMNEAGGRLSEAERRAAEGTVRIRELEALRTELDTHVDDLERQLGREGGHRGLPDALWRLELMRQHRAGWGRGPVPGIDDLERSAKRLANALSVEMELVREDVGTFAELEECSVDDALDASHALAALRMVQELLAAVAKRCDEITVTLRTTPEALGITLSCAGWVPDGDDLSAVDVVTAAGGELAGRVEVTEADGSFVVHVMLPRGV